MPQIHPTAILEGEIELADDVFIGPFCVLTGPITIGPGCRLNGGAWLTGPITLGANTQLLGGAWFNGPLTLGESNQIYPNVCLGYSPQDYKWAPSKPGAGVKIGSDNIFREGSTIHRATSDETPTTIGDRGMWMAQAHAGHDCVVGDDCIFANSVSLAGHVRIDDRVTMGGGAHVHQFCRVGRGVMMSGLAGAGRDVPPFFMLTGINYCGSLNLIGMRRSGMPKADIDDVRWVYKTLYRRGLSHKNATEELRKNADRPMVSEYLEFIETSKRGICSGIDDARRNNTHLKAD